MGPAERAVTPAVRLRLPWSAWAASEGEVFLDVPGVWDCVYLEMADAPALSLDAIKQELDRPIGSERLEVLAQGKRSACIAIDDRTRPLQTAVVLPELIDRLTQTGVPLESITIVVATGAHRRATEQDFEAKVGRPLLGRVRVVSHDPAGDLVDTGVTLGGVPVRINRAFAEAELKIGVSGVIPHPFAGFSGGGKILIPGLADLDVLARTHKFALMGFRGGARLEGNSFRAEMEAAVRRIGLDWTVNVALNSRREVAAVRAGDMVEAHRAAAAVAAACGQTAAPDRMLDALVVNAYPKDGELLQVEAALVPLRQGMLSWLAPGAPIVLTASCSEGLGHHALFGPGGRLFRKPSRKTFLNDHPLILFLPGVSKPDVAAAFWDGYPVCSTWDSVVSEVSVHLNDRPVVGIVPCAPLQVAATERASGK